MQLLGLVGTTTHISTEKLASQKIRTFLRPQLTKPLFSSHFKALIFSKQIFDFKRLFKPVNISLKLIMFSRFDKNTNIILVFLSNLQNREYKMGAIFQYLQ